MERTTCRYFKQIDTKTICMKFNKRLPDCTDCEVDSAPDAIYNDAMFARLVRDISPYGSEKLYEWLRVLIKEGVIDE